jgi:hypothetical protein
VDGGAFASSGFIDWPEGGWGPAPRGAWVDQWAAQRREQRP